MNGAAVFQKKRGYLLVAQASLTAVGNQDRAIKLVPGGSTKPA